MSQSAESLLGTTIRAFYTADVVDGTGYCVSQGILIIETDSLFLQVTNCVYTGTTFEKINDAESVIPAFPLEPEEWSVAKKLEEHGMQLPFYVAHIREVWRDVTSHLIGVLFTNNIGQRFGLITFDDDVELKSYGDFSSALEWGRPFNFREFSL